MAPMNQKRRLEQIASGLGYPDEKAKVQIVKRVNFLNLTAAISWARTTGAHNVAFVPLDGPIEEAGVEPAFKPDKPVLAIAFEGPRATTDQIGRLIAHDARELAELDDIGQFNEHILVLEDGLVVRVQLPDNGRDFPPHAAD